MSDFNLVPGLKGQKTDTVTPANTAKAYGSGSIEVYATPAMIGLLEGASLAAVDPVLPPGFSTVGVRLEVNHLAATPLGMTVRAEAQLIEIKGKKLTFSVAAFDEKDKIGEGLHERYVVEIEKFLSKATGK